MYVIKMKKIMLYMMSDILWHRQINPYSIKQYGYTETNNIVK